MFIKNIWYVAAWDFELESSGPLGRTIAGQPIVLYRRTGNTVVAMADRCPHRHAPLSLGRVEGDELRCMYHGLKFDAGGMCTAIPGSRTIPPNTHVRTFPVVEKWNWIWVWMGDPAIADAGLIPDAHGTANPAWSMRASALDYAADYQLINDNLCDLSHLDFVHETTLGAVTDSKWSDDSPKVTTLDDGILVERWFLNQSAGDSPPVDTWNSYRFLLPGLFIMTTKFFPVGTAAASGFNAPDAEPISVRIEQQAVTPTTAGRSRYLFATGLPAKNLSADGIEARYAVINAAFAEDKRMIEAQQVIWNQTPPDHPMAFIPQDKAPAIVRRLIARRIAQERAGDPEVPSLPRTARS